MKKKSGSSFAPVPAILNALDDLKAQNPVTLDVRGQSDMFDTLIIASGTSSRQVRALAQHVMEELKKKGFPPSGYEGLDAGEWALIDYGDIVVHVMLPDIRSFYDIEGLWQVPVVATTTNTTTTKPTAKAANTNKKAVSPTGTKKVSAAKKPTSSTKKRTDSSSAVKKPVAKKPVAKKTTEKKTIEKKTADKKTTDKKPKTTTRTTASKKTVGQPKTSSKTTSRTGTNAAPATRSKTSTPKKTIAGSAATRSRKKTT